MIYNVITRFIEPRHSIIHFLCLKLNLNQIVRYYHDLNIIVRPLINS